MTSLSRTVTAGGEVVINDKLVPISGSLAGKIRQLSSDPVLRRWILARAIGRERGATAIKNGWPSYLDEMPDSDDNPTADDRVFLPLEAAPPRRPFVASLPGLRLELAPGEEGRLGALDFPDLETHESHELVGRSPGAMVVGLALEHGQLHDPRV